MSWKTKVKNAINKLRRRAIHRALRAKLRNHQMSVLSANCVGALILHDLGEPFNSPFVNLFLSPADFIRFLQNRAFYQAQSLEFIDTEKPYPVAKLGDLTVHFMHYHNAKQAAEKWQQRLARLDENNLFVMMTDKDGGNGITDELVREFDALPFANKVIFTHKPHPQCASAFYIQGFEQQREVGDLFAFSGWNGKKYYDQFDFVGWFNQGKQ